jgi:hypothetical protein
VLHIKLNPGLRIEIGSDVVIDVVLDARRKLALKVSAPRTCAIEWATPAPAEPAADPEKHHL